MASFQKVNSIDHQVIGYAPTDNFTDNKKLTSTSQKKVRKHILPVFDRREWYHPNEDIYDHGS